MDDRPYSTLLDKAAPLEQKLRDDGGRLPDQRPLFAAQSLSLLMTGRGLYPQDLALAPRHRHDQPGLSGEAKAAM